MPIEINDPIKMTSSSDESDCDKSSNYQLLHLGSNNVLLKQPSNCKSSSVSSSSLLSSSTSTSLFTTSTILSCQLNEKIAKRQKKSFNICAKLLNNQTQLCSFEQLKVSTVMNSLLKCEQRLCYFSELFINLRRTWNRQKCEYFSCILYLIDLFIIFIILCLII